MSAPPADVAAAFAAFAAPERAALMRLRELIFEVAAQTDGIGPLQETLKWGQPAYLTPTTKSGTTIRLGSANPGEVALYTHCQSSVISDFAAHAGDGHRIEGNRGVHLAIDNDLDHPALRQLIRSALTYHQRSKAH